MKNWLYYLLEEDGRSIQIKNGVVTSTSTPKPLPHTPDKWQEIAVAWERDLAKHGIQRNFSTGIDFIRDGAHIIRDAFYKRNVERRMYLLIQRLTLDLQSNTFRWLYNYFYKGEIDMSTCNDGDFTATVNIMEGNLMRKLNAFYNQVYEFPIDTDEDMKSVRMDGIAFKQEAKYTLIDDLEITTSDGFAHFFLPFILTNESTSGIGTTGFKSQDFEPFTPAALDYIDDSLNWFHQNNTTFVQQVNITGRFYGVCLDAGPGFIYPKFLKSSQTSENDYELVVGGIPLVDDQEFDEDVDITILLQPGENLFFYQEANASTVKFYPGSDFTITTNFKYKQTYCKGITAWTLYKRLIGKVTGNETYAQSDLLQAFENIIMTSGDAIRSIDGAKIKTSLAEFFKSMDAVLCGGMAIEGDKIVFEDRDHFYDDSNPITLGSVRDCKRSYAKELMANTFRIGYPESKIDDTNGKYSVHNSISFTSPVTRVVKEYVIESSYLADPYLIETTRINLDGKTTTDNSSDNRVFMLNTEPEQVSTATASLSFLAADNLIIAPLSLSFLPGQLITISGSTNNDRQYRVVSATNFIFFQWVAVETVPAGGSLTDEGPVDVTVTWNSGIIQKLLRVTYDAVEGIPDESIDTIFNIELFTPKRMALRHGKWIRAMLHGFDTEKLLFQTTEKNNALKTTLGTEVIDEDADIEIGDLDEPLFIPKIFDFETEVPIDLVDLFEANPNRCFEFTYLGVTYKGFNIKSALMPNTLQPQSFRLLSVASNDFSSLVE